MKALALLLGGLLVAAPAAAVCACAEPVPSKVPMGCEGSAGCCCGDPAAPGPEEACPRSEKALDAAEWPEAPVDEGGASLPASLPPLMTADLGPALSTPDDSSPAPPRTRV
jgi:hypothetical protein